MAKQQQETSASLRPSDASAGGALIDDADVTIKSGTFQLYDFNGKAPTKSCLTLVLVTEDGAEHIEYLSMADPTQWVPSSDNKKLIAVGDKTTLADNSKGMLFIVSLVNAGFPEDDVSDSADFADGTRVHIKRKAAPASWSKMPRRGGDDQREATILEVTAILEEKKVAAKGKGAAVKGAAKAAPAKASKAADLDEELTAMVVQAVTEAGGSIAKKALVPAIFRIAASHESKKALTKRVFEDDFLEGLAGSGEVMFDAEEQTVSAL